jgi:transposase
VERRIGAITKTGNSHLRRVLVESAWLYRHRLHVWDQRRSAEAAPRWRQDRR